MKKILLSAVTVVGFAIVSQAQFKVGIKAGGKLTNQRSNASAQSTNTSQKDNIVFLNDNAGKRNANDFANNRTAKENSFTHIKTNRRVAVIPMIYIGDDNETRMDDMRFYLQDIAISCLGKSAAELKFLDANEINAILLKNGISDFNIRQYTPKELADILHVEYIIMGSVVQDLGKTVTAFHSNNNRRQKIEHRYRETRLRGHNHRCGSSVTTQNIETRVTLSIYNETGEKIHTSSRRSLLTGPGAYRNTIQYLLKRTPLYNR